MSERKRRFSVTFTGPYIDALDLLVKTGLYINHQAAIRAGVRLVLKEHKIPLTPEEGSGW